MPTVNPKVDMFIKIKGNRSGVIQGESKDAVHKSEIQVLHYEWGMTQPYDKTGNGLATGKRVHDPFTFLMDTQAATPKLLSCASTGEVLDSVILSCRKAGTAPGIAAAAGIPQKDYMTWEMKNALIVRMETGYLVSGEVLPYDKVSMSFREITMTYNEQASSGGVGGGIVFTDDWAI
jgi:type VI secretion system secreted protein Hcp